VWDSRDGKRLRELPLPSILRAAAYSPDGEHLATLEPDSWVWIRSAATLKPVRDPLRGAGFGLALAYTRRGDYLALRDAGGVKVWEVATGRLAAQLVDTTGQMAAPALAFSPDGDSLAAGNYQGIILVWQWRTDRPARRLTGHTGMVSGVAYSPDGKRLASCSWDGSVKVWDPAAGEELLSLTARDAGQFYCVAFSPCGKRLFAGAAAGVRVWEGAGKWRAEQEAPPREDRPSPAAPREAKSLALAGKWEAAAALLPENRRADGHYHFERAALVLLAGDAEGHRKAVAAMRRRLEEGGGGGNGIRAYHLTRAAALHPEGDITATATLAKQELDDNAGQFWALTLRGAILVRQGKPADGIGYLQRSLAADRSPGRAVLNHLWLALAELRRGDRDKARQWLGQAASCLDGLKDVAAAVVQGREGLDYHNWLEACSLRREIASALAAGTDPR
jgi:hypothetical protein